MSLCLTKILICYIVLYYCAFTSANRNEGVLEKIKNGLKYARNYLETAKKIADLVAKNLKKHNNDKKRGDEGVKNEQIPKVNFSSHLTSAFFRLLGLDSPKIAAITVNSAFFLAQLISSLMENKHEAKGRRAENINDDESDFDPLKFIMNTRNPKIQSLLKLAQSSELPEKLINKLDNTDLSCVKLLVCKITPIILHAQESLKNNTINRRFDITSWLPDQEVFEENGDNCDDKFHDCELFPDEFDPN